jgi:hypothetical protein
VREWLQVRISLTIKTWIWFKNSEIDRMMGWTMGLANGHLPRV